LGGLLGTRYNEPTNHADDLFGEKERQKSFVGTAVDGEMLRLGYNRFLDETVSKSPEGKRFCPFIICDFFISTQTIKYSVEFFW
jgi:hypothetical protein